MKDLAGRTAFVTGAASGIGLGIATALSQAGVKVMLCDIEEEALAKAVEGLKTRTNADVEGVRADVSLKEELQAAADATVALWQDPYSGQQCGRWWRRQLWRMDRRGLELDSRRQPDVGGLGHRDFWAAD